VSARAKDFACDNTYRSGAKCSVSQSASATVPMTIGGSDCGRAGWFSNDYVAGGASVNDKATTPCTPSAGNDIWTFRGNSGASNSFESPLLDLTGGTHTYFPAPFGNLNYSHQLCDGSITNGTALAPIAPANTVPTFTLPKTLQPLAASRSFQATTFLDYFTPVEWKLDYALTMPSTGC
jgi:hypothetical protein